MSAYQSGKARRPLGALALVLVLLALVAGLRPVAPAAAAFPGTNGKLVYHSNAGIETINPDGSGKALLSPGQSGSWSPDGTQLAFSMDGNIFRLDADGVWTLLSFNTGWEDSPAWSPDGTKIAFMRTLPDGNNEIFTMDAGNGANQQNISNNPAQDGHPVWSPDGSRIAFHSNRTGAQDYDIFTMDPDGGNVIQLTNNGDWDWLPEWSPNGTKIAFTHGRIHDQEVYVLTVSSLDQVNVTNDPDYKEYGSAWSPDGSMLAFTRTITPNENERLFVLKFADNTLSEVTTGGVARLPNWQTLFPLPFAQQDAYITLESRTLSVSAPGVLANDLIPKGTHAAILATDVSKGDLLLAADGSFTYSPDDGYAGLDSFTYYVSLDGRASDTATVTINVLPHFVAATNDSYRREPSGKLTVPAPGLLANDFDTHSDDLSAELVGNAAHGDVTLDANGGFTYTPDPGYNGFDSFTYQVSDGTTSSNIATVTINDHEIAKVNGRVSGFATSTDWSPDGSHYIYSSDVTGLPQLYTRDAEGGNETLVGEYVTGEFPAWSPDGGRILFTYNQSLYVMNADGSAAHRVTLSPDLDGGVRTARWSPDGSKIVFDGCGIDQGDICTANADGTGAAYLIDDPAFDSWPDWSPDGSEIVMSRGSGDVCDLYASSLTTGVMRRITNEEECETHPRWSPDGAWIAFQGHKQWVSTDPHIYSTRSDSSDSKGDSWSAVDSRPGYPAWQPIISEPVTTYSVGTEAQLAAAIEDANGIRPGAFVLDLSGDIQLTGQLPVIRNIVAGTITLAGNGHTLTGDGEHTILRVEGNTRATIGDLVLTGGKGSVGISSGWARFGGGAIFNEGGSLTLEHSEIRANTSESGGGLYNLSGEVVVHDSLFQDNHGADWGDGGAIYNESGEISILASRFIGNNAGWAGAIACTMGSAFIGDSWLSDNYASDHGGALQGWLCGFRIRNSTFARNHASASGGVISVWESGNIDMANSTLSGNWAGNGGAIATVGYAHGPIVIRNSTLTGNTATGRGGALDIHIEEGNIEETAAILIENSILSGNRAPLGSEISNIYPQSPPGLVVLDGHNLLGDAGVSNGAAFVGANPGTSDTTATSDGTDPRALAAILDPALADNGGPTLTHALVLGSPALDRAPSADCEVEPLNGLDQRGQPRNINADAIGSGNECDIGAFELSPPDDDADGIGDHVEDAAPNGGDGNNDGVADSDQANVSSVPNASNGLYLTLETPSGTELTGVVAMDSPAPESQPAGTDFPLGFIKFGVSGLTPGVAMTVEILVDGGVTAETYYKYGPTPVDPTDHWYEFLYDGTTGAEILPDRIILHFVDGQRGDGDLTADGDIEDPGAPALQTRVYVSPTATGKVGAGTAAKSFTGADILSYVKATNTWDVFYDGSYVKTPKNLGAFAFKGADVILGFSAAGVIPGLGATAVPPQDLVRFTPAKTGYNNTAGTFALYFDGSDAGLTTSGETIDALWIDGQGRLYISTAGTGEVPVNSAAPTGAKFKFQDEDILRFTPATLGATTAGTWALYWDPTAMPGMSAEDINGYWADAATGDRYVTILGAFTIGNVAYGRQTGNGKTIIRFAPNAAAPGGWAPVEKVGWLAPGATFPSSLDGMEMAR